MAMKAAPERRLGDWVRARVPGPVAELVMFVLKQAWACLFGAMMLGAIVASKAVWQADWPVARYDALVVFAVGVQALFLWLRLETWEEARVILLFHLTGTVMEWFKVDAGSWAYPEPGVLKLMQVPLFSGFMYAAVGSYMLRVIRIFHMRFAPYPPYGVTLGVAGLIYVNFFSHHFLPDIRWALFAATILIWGRTRVWFRTGAAERWMPMPVAGLLSAVALFVAENIGTLTGTWLYAGHKAAHQVSYGKFGSWYLLLYVAFVTVTYVARDALGAPVVTKSPASAGPAPEAPPRPEG
jgi:uncharacterized membrane protein YoaT (DUF817 family)